MKARARADDTGAGGFLPVTALAGDLDELADRRNGVVTALP